MFNQLGLIGCGLMGGSFALALKRAGLVKRVIGYSKSPSTTEKAKKLGVIDTAAESALLAVSGSDIVLIAVPVSATEATFKAVRHLPHMLAFAYFNSVARQPAGRDYLSLAGPGFRDFTRIAASDSTMWRDVLMSNREEVLKQSMRFRHTLEAMEHALKSGNIEA